MIRYLLLVLAIIGMTCPLPAIAAEHGAADGDLLTVNYTVTTLDGKLVRTTSAERANDTTVPRHAGYGAPAAFGPAELVPGAPDLLPGISNALIGMEPGTKKMVQLTPEQAFGPKNPALEQKIPLQRKIPRTVSLAPAEYLQRFNSFPSQRKLVPLTPWMQAKVVEVREQQVLLELQLPEQRRFEEPFGYITVEADEQAVTLVLHPTVGAAFDVEGKPGRIAAVDATHFTVDSNHPLAGVPLQLELELVTRMSKQQLPTGTPLWKEDHDTALGAAQAAGRPALLLLYADWCSWCKKLQNETFVDPRIAVRRDRLDWIRVNSDKDKAYMEKYGQKGFPLVVLFNADGTVAERVDGYVDGERMGFLLDTLIGSQQQKTVAAKEK